MCWNLRNKRYCIGNRQYDKEGYERERSRIDLSSRRQYAETLQTFRHMLLTQAWWRADHNEQCENASGDYLEQSRDLENCYLLQEGDHCVNVMRSMGVRDCVDAVSPYSGELISYSCLVQDRCYDIRYCWNISNSRFMEYCGVCSNCEHCFGCCGLVGKQYYIFNTPYSPEEYARTVAAIKQVMRDEGVYGTFFPGYFACSPYDDSLSGYHWPLPIEQQRQAGFRTRTDPPRPSGPTQPTDSIPDRSSDAPDTLAEQVFWDKDERRPFQITRRDIRFSRERGIPLPDSHYLARIKSNFRWVACTGELRTTVCAVTGRQVTTSLPPQLDKRILSREAYLAEVY